MSSFTVSRRGLGWGCAAGAALTGGFLAVVAGTAGWQHLVSQLRGDWWLLIPLLAGFMTQVTLMVELRRRHRLAHAAAVSVGAGAGVSGLAMWRAAPIIWRSWRRSRGQLGLPRSLQVLSVR